MPSAANAKSEKPASTEAADNTPIRQIMTIIEHKIRNLEKRKSKLTSYRDLQKAGKELNSDQKVAVAKYDEVAQTLEFARDLSKQVTAIAVSAEREAKKQAKKDAWVRYAAESNKIREVLLILDALMQMGNTEAREDFLNGTNGASKLTEDDLRILDELYPEVIPKHELNEEGQPGFHNHSIKATEHLYAIIEGKPKEVLGTTYTHIKDVISMIHECGYFDKVLENPVNEPEPEVVEEASGEPVLESPAVYPPAAAPPLPVPPAPAVVPAPAYPLRPLPPITLQEIEHAYFSQQYPQQRPISEVIGSQNFFFLQESEIDSPASTPQPPVINQASPPAPIPTQTFTNQHYVQIAGARGPDPTAMPMPPQPHFPPRPEHAGYPTVPMPQPAMPPQVTAPPPLPPVPTVPQQVNQQSSEPGQPTPAEDHPASTQADENKEDEWKDSQSPERDENGERRVHGQGDGQRYRRYRGGGRGAPNGYRGRGAFSGRQNNGRSTGEHQNRSGKDGYQNRQYNDSYQNRPPRGNDNYYGNGESGDGENGTRDRYSDNSQNYQGGFKGRGRGGPRGGSRPPPRAPRPQHYTRKNDNAE